MKKTSALDSRSSKWLPHIIIVVVAITLVAALSGYRNNVDPRAADQSAAATPNPTVGFDPYGTFEQMTVFEEQSIYYARLKGWVVSQESYPAIYSEIDGDLSLDYAWTTASRDRPDIDALYGVKGARGFNSIIRLGPEKWNSQVHLYVEGRYPRPPNLLDGGPKSVSVRPPKGNLTVVAAGNPAQNVYPQFQLFVKDVAVGSPITVTNQLKSYQVELAENSIQDLKIKYTNDLSTVINGQRVDRDLRIEKITYRGETYQSSAADTYSTGTISNGKCGTPGFYKSQWLHCNGYFQFQMYPNMVPTPVSSATPAPVTPAPTTATPSLGFIQAEAFTSNTGIETVGGIRGVENKGTYIARFDKGDAVGYGSVSLTGKTAVTLNASSRGSNGTIDVRIGSSTGTIVASFKFPKAIGSTGNFVKLTPATLPALSGKQSVYLTGRDTYGIADIDYIEFQ